jgi:hypothetical protein
MSGDGGLPPGSSLLNPKLAPKHLRIMPQQRASNSQLRYTDVIVDDALIARRERNHIGACQCQGGLAPGLPRWLEKEVERRQHADCF